MYDFIQPHNGPVVDGLEGRELVYAELQPQYNPLRTLVSIGRARRVISRWTLTEEQRKAVAVGADIFLELLTFGHPLQPIRMAVSDGKLDTEWVRACLLDESVEPKPGLPPDHPAKLADPLPQAEGNTLENEVLDQKAEAASDPLPQAEGAQ